MFLTLDTLSQVIRSVWNLDSMGCNNECWTLPVRFYWQYKSFHKNIERLLLSVAIFSKFIMIVK